MAIILKANKVNLFVSSVLFVFWYHSLDFLDTQHICDISRLRVKLRVIRLVNIKYQFVERYVICENNCLAMILTALCMILCVVS
jgi:hypothetical protein